MSDTPIFDRLRAEQDAEVFRGRDRVLFVGLALLVLAGLGLLVAVLV